MPGLLTFTVYDLFSMAASHTEHVVEFTIIFNVEEKHVSDFNSELVCVHVG